jgi:hypothetical protein
MTSSSSSSSAEQNQNINLNPKPLFTDDHIQYIKIISGEGEDQQIFILDKDAAMRFSSTISDLFNIGDQMKEMGVQDDPSFPSSSSSSTSPPSSLIPHDAFLEFRELPGRALEICIKFFYWKKRWQNVVIERIPDFPLPADRNIGLHTLIAANELRC